LYVASICNTIGTNAREDTALTRMDNAALLDMLK
jgi:hypothetical protein